jgi:hypothetical protein
VRYDQQKLFPKPPLSTACPQDTAVYEYEWLIVVFFVWGPSAAAMVTMIFRCTFCTRKYVLPSGKILKPIKKDLLQIGDELKKSAACLQIEETFGPVNLQN